MKPEASQALEGRTIADKFLIESIIGQGAMGAVYRAKWVALDKVVALKVMNPDIAQDQAFTARFHREAKAASKLDHPNSVRVLDFGEEPDGLLYIAMEYLAGRDLLALMRQEWPLTGERTIDILMQTLSALGVAHENGIVHRDLKPENIMVLPGTDDEGRPIDVVKVCDFGIAKMTNDRGETNLSKGPLTSSGTLVGTPEYMSPEQGRGDALDARSDLYSVGVILFHMLTGKVPFVAENAIGVILKHITDDPPRPSLLAPNVDSRLEGICLKGMRKRREERYQSAREMRNDLRSVRDQGRGAMAGTVTPDPSYPGLVPRLVAGHAAGHVSGGVAPTMRDFSPSTSSGPNVEVQRMPTATGLAVSAVARPRRALVTSIAVVATLAGVGGVVGVRALGVGGRGHAAAHPGATATAPAVSAPPLVDLVPLVPASDPATALPPLVPAPTGSSAHASTVSRGHGAHAASPPQANASPLQGATSPPVVAPPVSPPQASEGPAYDPSQATVDIGSITPNNVNGDAVRAAIRNVAFTTCYRNALRARGRREFGSATLNLSIDENGKVLGAILTGADWLPEMSRCIQGGASGVQLRPGSVSAGGGTAEVWLSFRAP